MAKPFYNTKNIVINDNISIYFKTQDTSYGFRHLAELRETHGTGHEYTSKGTEAKCTYYNRTWESFDYQTVGHKVIAKHFGDNSESKDIIKMFDDFMNGKVEDFYNTVGMIAKIGNVLMETQTEKNDWKKRMLSAGIPGLSIPEDWDTLSEDEKEARLNKVIELSMEDK